VTEDREAVTAAAARGGLSFAQTWSSGIPLAGNTTGPGVHIFSRWPVIQTA